MNERTPERLGPAPTPGTVLAHLPAGVVVLDRDGGVIAHNPAAARLLGASVAAEGATCCDLVGCRRPGTALDAAA